MHTLFIIMLAPMALAAGFLLLRLMATREFWILALVILGILALWLNLITAPYRYSGLAPASTATLRGLAEANWASSRSRSHS
jgi:hypothetical protein